MDMTDVTRRKTLTALGATGSVVLAGCGANDDTADESDDDTDETGTEDNDGTATEDRLEGSISIGVLQDFSGAVPEYGHQATTGFYCGLGYKADGDPLPEDAVDEGDYDYTVGDIDVEMHVRDTQFQPGQAQELATELVQDEGVDVLYGGVQTGSAIRIINTVIDRSELPYIAGPAAGGSITNDAETCREEVFRAHETTSMDARAGGQFIANETDVERMALFGADNDFGRDAVSSYRAVLEEQGVEVTMERFVPPGHAEWSGLLEQAEAEADGMAGGFTAETLVPLLQTYFSMEPEITQYGGLATRLTLTPLGTLLENMLDELTVEAIQAARFGPFSTRYHWNQYDNEINDWYVETHRETYDVVPDLLTSGGFTAASSIIQAFHQHGQVSGDAVATELRGMTVTDTPKGESEYEYQLHNNQARSKMTIANAIPTEDEGWPAAIQPGEPLHTVPAEATTPPADSDEVSCDLS